MTYEKPVVKIGENNGTITPECTPGLAIAVAVAGVVWNVGGVYSYAAVAVAAVVAAVAFVWKGTGCWPS
ncbi:MULTISPECIES: hypothetical protein [Thermoanaerobacterium]|uniref:hypothetical protein n=1 Tax=Thermoanaerobacterium TaxID=28895 RepID=UPI0005EE946C|nr:MULTISPECIES: hypothetical protein [Thermoanaerobacterium]KAA5806616.1 hypothetical protein F1655_09140 [Thermoanaerobacterium thermosaccharolyticum]SNX55025.1 hypothetical protein SAMN05660242_2808 [Thermoanaerobacterium sp. RBIITD]